MQAVSSLPEFGGPNSFVSRGFDVPDSSNPTALTVGTKEAQKQPQKNFAIKRNSSYEESESENGFPPLPSQKDMKLNFNSESPNSSGMYKFPSESKPGRLSHCGSKPGNKKSFVWNYFKHPEGELGVIDRTRTQCLVCKSQLAFNASGTTTTMLNHLKSRHGDIAQREEQQRAKGSCSLSINGKRKEDTGRHGVNRPNGGIFGSNLRSPKNFSLKQDSDSSSDFTREELHNFPPLSNGDFQSAKDAFLSPFLFGVDFDGSTKKSQRSSSVSMETASAPVVSPNRFSPKASSQSDSGPLPHPQLHDVNSFANSFTFQPIEEECRNRNQPSKLLPQNSPPFLPFTTLHPPPLTPAMLSQFPGILPPFNCCPMSMSSLDQNRENNVIRGSPPSADVKNWFSQLAGQTTPDFVNLGFLNKKQEFLGCQPNLNEVEQFLKSIPRPQENGVRGGPKYFPPPPLLSGLAPPRLSNTPPYLLSPLANMIQNNPLMMQFLSKVQKQQQLLSNFGAEIPKWMPELSNTKEAGPPRSSFREKQEMDSTGTAKRKRGRPIYISPDHDLKRPTVDKNDIPEQSQQDVENLSRITSISLPSVSAASTTTVQRFPKSSQIEESIPEDLTVASRLNIPSSDSPLNSTVVANQSELLEEKLAYFLIRDLHPPQILDGEGFKTFVDQLIGLKSDDDRQRAGKRLERVSSVRMRSEVLPRIRKNIQLKFSLNPNSTPLRSSNALAVEFWECDAGRSQTEFASISVNSTGIGSNFNLWRTANLKVTTNLARLFHECCSEFSVSTTTEPHTTLPHPLVTNRPDRIEPYLSSSTASDKFVVLPCLIYALSSAVSTGLQVPQVSNLLCQCIQLTKCLSHAPATSTKDFAMVTLPNLTKAGTGDNCCLQHEDRTKSTESEAESTPIGWRTAFEVLKQVQSLSLATTDEQGKRIDLLKSVIENLNQTLEFIHQKGVILTASMVWPILVNLRETHLISKEKENEDEMVRLFKTAVSRRLDELYPASGDAFETLQIASLIDPRFKARAQEQQPSTVQLLKTRVEELEKGAECNSPSAEGYSMPANFSSSEQLSADNRATSQNSGLERVFGTQFFVRPCLSEVERYLREDSIGLQEDPFKWWVERLSKYPRIGQLAQHYLSIPLASFKVSRLHHLEEGSAFTSPTDSFCLPGVQDAFSIRHSNFEPEDISDYTFLWHNWSQLAD